MKKFNIGNVKVEMNPNGFPKGLILNRELTTKECRYIMHKFLGINIANREELGFTVNEYKEYNNELTEKVNMWLTGYCDDYCIQEYAFDCMDESLGLMNMITILSYLKEKEIID